jgi:hypothetical protein
MAAWVSGLGWIAVKQLGVGTTGLAALVCHVLIRAAVMASAGVWPTKE